MRRSRLRLKRQLPTVESFDLTGLSGVFNQATNAGEATVAFEVTVGHGTFVFMMFFSADDPRSKKNELFLYLYLKNTNVMLDFHLYGIQAKGQFLIYPTAYKVQKIREELRLQGGEKAFNIKVFLNILNARLPPSVTFAAKRQTLRTAWPYVSTQLNGVIDDPDKIYFVGYKNLSATGLHPREKTLRKLFLYVDGDPGVISQLIKRLKQNQITCVWTSDQKRAKDFHVNI